MSETNGNGERKRFDAYIESKSALWISRALTPLLLTGLLGTSLYIGSMFVAQLEEQTGAISRLGAKIDQGLDTVDKRLDALDVRVTRTETRLEAIRETR